MSKTIVTVKSEPSTYGAGSENSYFLDLARSAHPGSRLHGAAVKRLNQHAQEIGWGVANKSDDGARAVREMQTRGRSFNGTEDGARAAVRNLTEYRALSTATNSGGAFVTPQYIVEDWASYRTYEPTFCAQTNKVPDSGYGMSINVPAITAAASVAQQTEGASVTASNPTGGYLTSTSPRSPVRSTCLRSYSIGPAPWASTGSSISN